MDEYNEQVATLVNAWALNIIYREKLLIMPLFVKHSVHREDPAERCRPKEKTTLRSIRSR